MKYAPGKYEAIKNHRGYDIYTPAWGRIARVWSGDTYDEGNATLFAAAPELLEALRDAHERLCSGACCSHFAVDEVTGKAKRHFPDCISRGVLLARLAALNA